MNVINCFRARVMNSSLSAFSLALADSDKVNFARKIITVKNQNAHCRLINLHSNASEYHGMEQKINQYTFFLNILDSIESVKVAGYKCPW